jgi:hypothetical protein
VGAFSVKFGGKGLIGLDFGKGPFVEADYTYPGDSRSATINAGIGYRF